jgi:hypothetical protein
MTYGVLNYSLNNSEFTEKYCENKAKPVMKCNGKCKLAKLAKETEKNDSDKNISIEKELELYFQPIKSIDFVVFLPKKNAIKSKCQLHNSNPTEPDYRPPNYCFSLS